VHCGRCCRRRRVKNKFTTSIYISSITVTLAHLQDFYSVLAIPRHAPHSQIKSAYHRLLLQSHPDKRINQSTNIFVDITLLKEAYTTLSNPDLRAAYDARLEARKIGWHSSQTVSRPAQVVSLEEFDQGPDDDEQGPWTYPCRCGGSYTISTVLMEEGKHLVACSSCSEVIWVGYELVEDV